MGGDLVSGMTQPFDLDAMRADMEAGTQPPWHIKAKSVPMSIEGSIHQVTDAASFPAAFVPAWDNPELGETDGTEEALANARRIARVPAMEAEILRLTAENERLREGGTYSDGYADALEAAAREARDMADANGPNGTEAAIRALPIKEKPMREPLSDPCVKALVAEVGKHLVTMESAGFPTRQLYGLRTALAALQKEQDT